MGRKKAYTYGEQKVFGPIGSALGGVLAGLAVDNYKPKHLSPYFAAFYLYVPLSLLMLPLLHILTKQADWNYGRRKKGEKKIPIIKEVMNVFKKSENFVFLFSCIISGTSLMILFHYLFIYMNRVMKPTKTMMSMATVISMASELLIYPFSSKIIRFLGGQIRCVTLGIFSSAVRLAILSYCTHPWQVFLIQPLHGIGMSLGWTSMIEHIWAIFPKEITTTAIGILVCLHWTGPGILTNVIGGYLYRIYGGPPLFRAMAIIAGSWCIFMVVYYEILNKKSHSEASSTGEIGRSHDIDIELEEGTKTV